METVEIFFIKKIQTHFIPQPIVFQNIWIQWQIWPILGTVKLIFDLLNQIKYWFDKGILRQTYSDGKFLYLYCILRYFFNYLGSKKGTIFYYNPRKVHSKALILLWNDHQFSIFWFLTKVVVSVKLCGKSKSQVR